MYHGIRRAAAVDVDDRFAAVNPSLDEFRDQIRYLARRYATVSLDDVVAALEGQATLPRRALLVTFDDGFRSVLTDAAPVLRQAGVRAVAFVISGALERRHMPWFVPFNRTLRAARAAFITWDGRTWSLREAADRHAFAECFKARLYELPPAEHAGLVRSVAAALGLSAESVSEHFDWDYPDDMRFLSPAELREWTALGMAVGAHSDTHAGLGRGSTAEVEAEVAGSGRCLRSLGFRPDCFSYPDGRYGPLAIEVAARVYRAAFGVSVPEDARQRSLLPRVALGRERPRDLWRLFAHPSRGLQHLEEAGVSILRHLGARLPQWA
jgi:peptidoglycan/xylan/chitin deacetylase (PgdA/CDA1 family)